MGVFASNSLKNGAVKGPKRLKIDQKGLQIVLMNQSIPFLGPKKIWRNWGVPPPIYGEIRQIVFETFLKSATTFPGPQERISTLDQGWSESQAIAREGMECRQARGG